MTLRDMAALAAIATAACSSTSDHRGPANGHPKAWLCDHGRGAPTVVVIQGPAVVAINVTTGEMTEVARSTMDEDGLPTLRDAAIAGTSVYWTDNTGVHARELGAATTRDVLRTPSAFAIAADDAYLVYADGDGNLTSLDLQTGGSRLIAEQAVGSDDPLLVKNGAAYWANVHLRGAGGAGPPDTLWAVPVGQARPPAQLASIDNLGGFCVGDHQRVVWLEQGHGQTPRVRLVDGTANRSLAQLAGNERERSLYGGRTLAATDTGFVFTTSESTPGDVTAWHVTFDGALTKLSPRIPEHEQLLGMAGRALVALSGEGKVLRVETSGGGAAAP